MNRATKVRGAMLKRLVKMDLNKLGVTKEINSSNELSLSLVEEFRDDKPKKLEISAKIENYGQNIFNNVIIELKKYI